MQGKPRLARKTARRLIGFAAAAAAVLSTAALTTGPARASNAAATPAHHGRMATVHLHGKTFHVELNKPSGVVPMRGKSAANTTKANTASTASTASTFSTDATVYPPTTSTSGLVYNNGPLETAPVIYLDFWGNQWDSDANNVQSYMQNFFSSLGAAGDTWSTVNSQYTDSSGASPSFNGAVLGGSWVDDSAAAPASAQQADIAAEADNAAAHFGVSGPNVDIFVMSPSGTSPDNFPNGGFCAWHNWDGNVAYTNMPYVLDAGSSCGASSVASQLDGFSIVGGHEYAEAITDPEPSSGWVDAGGQEIGDLCAWDNDQAISFSTGSYAMQPLYSNKDNGCVFSSQ